MSTLTATTSKPRSPLAACKPVERGHLRAARRAPGRPQVEQHRAAAKIGERQFAAAFALEGELFGLARVSRDGQRGDFALREGRKLGGEPSSRRGNRPRPCRSAAPSRIGRPQRRQPRARRKQREEQIAGAAGFRSSSCPSIQGDSHEQHDVGRPVQGRPAEVMEEINASIDFDRKLAAQDIAGSQAHVAMLARQGIVEAADAEAIAKGLAQVKGEIEAGTFSFSRALEDIHMNVESRLAEIVGPAAGRLHTARSRNDQVAVDFRLWVRDAIDAILAPDRRVAARARRPRARLRRHGHAGLHPSAIGAAGHFRPSSARLCRDAGARRGTFQGRAQAPQRMSARRGRARRHLVPDRPRDDRQGARLRPADRQFARQRRRPRLRARGAQRRGDCGDASFPLRRGDRAVDDAAIRLRPALRRLLDRLVDHAAEAQSRRGRTRARQDRPHRRRARRAAYGDEGPAARLFQGHAGGQGRRASTRSGRCRCALPR